MKSSTQTVQRLTQVKRVICVEKGLSYAGNQNFRLIPTWHRRAIKKKKSHPSPFGVWKCICGSIKQAEGCRGARIPPLVPKWDQFHPKHYSHGGKSHFCHCEYNPNRKTKEKVNLSVRQVTWDLFPL